VLAKKFSSLLGVGKLRGELLTFIVNFFCEGLNFACAELQNIGFVEALAPYVRFLGNDARDAVLLHLQRSIENNAPLAKELASQQSACTKEEFKRLLDFMHLLDGSKPSVARRAAAPAPIASTAQHAEGNSASKRKAQMELPRESVRRSSRVSPSAVDNAGKLDSVAEDVVVGLDIEDEDDNYDADVQLMPSRRRLSHTLSRS
jgi:hypothetical protein